MKIGKFITVVTLLVLLSSCTSINIGQKPQITKHALAVNSKFEVIWERTDIEVLDSDTGTMITTAPKITLVEGRNSRESNTTIFRLFALNTTDGNIIWQKQINSSSEQISIDDSMLYRGTLGAGHIQAYSIKDGRLVWDTSLPSAHSISYLYPIQDRVFALTNNDKLFVLSKEGKILDTEYSPDRIFFKAKDISFVGKSRALEAISTASGNVKWHIDINKDFRFAPIFIENTIYLVTKSLPNSIYSIDQTSGGLNWNLPTNAISNICILGAKLYFLTSDGYLKIVDRNDGQEIGNLEFLPHFDPELQIGRYFVSADPKNNILIISFGDSDQILGIKERNP